jgi:hypothetical protein
MSRVDNGWIVSVEAESSSKELYGESQIMNALFGNKPRRQEDTVTRIFYSLGDIANWLVQLEKAENLTDEVKP